MRWSNKKGDGDSYGIMEIIIIGLIIAGIILFAVLKANANAKSETKKLTSCSGPYGAGSCKSSCTADEISLPNWGECKAPTSTCCIAKDLGTSNVDNYGATSEYSFSVEWIGMNAVHGCTEDKNNGVWNCAAGTTVEFYVKVKNTGTKTVDVFGNPEVKQDERSTMVWLSGDKNPQTVAAGGETDHIAAGTLTIDKNAQKYRVYAAAKCLSKECTDAAGADGVFVINKNNWIDIYVTSP